MGRPSSARGLRVVPDPSADGPPGGPGPRSLINLGVYLSAAGPPPDGGPLDVGRQLQTVPDPGVGRGILRQPLDLAAIFRSVLADRCMSSVDGTSP